jgi:DNA-directed RNA polymerase specialized sigma24 family protein
MADSPQILWPSLDASYDDQFGRIDQDVHHAGGELWPWAAGFAWKTLHDEAEGQTILLRVCARITEKRAGGDIQVGKLIPYLRTSFKREVLARLKAQRLSSLEPGVELESDSDVDLDRKILFEQILARMDPANRRITEFLILGFTFEEIARKDGTQSNVLRSRYSKQLAKIRKELDVERL